MTGRAVLVHGATGAPGAPVAEQLLRALGAEPALRSELGAPPLPLQPWAVEQGWS